MLTTAVKRPSTLRPPLPTSTDFPRPPARRLARFIADFGDEQLKVA
ncbi:hypothetical protein ACQPZX_01385 [Actinoplanes sp. CA-142083]